MASMGLSIDEQKAVDRFRTAVVEPSQTKLVILDFWAEWCGPCKALTPVLEKVAADYGEKGVLLAKVNVDEEQFIAAQFQVRSIPTVYAFFEGKPVDGFQGAIPGSEIKKFIEGLAKLAGGSADDGLADALAAAEEMLTEGAAADAAETFAAILEEDPANGAAYGGLIRALFPRDPSWLQWPLLEASIEDNIVADFTQCNKSFKCSYRGVDL